MLAFATVVVGLMGLFPAWETDWFRRGNVRRVDDLGYGFLFSPPPLPTHSSHSRPQIAVDRLVTQWAMVVLVAAGAMIAMGRKPETVKAASDSGG